MQRNISTPLYSKKASLLINETPYSQAQSQQSSQQQQQQPIQQITGTQQQPSSTLFSQLLNSQNAPLISALSAAVYCQNKLIYNKNGQEALEIASLTKVMTFFISLKLSQKHDLDPQSVYVRVPKFAAYICGTSAFLRNGEYIKLNDLFYALMLPSGNDAACSLANFFGQLELRKAQNQSSFLDDKQKNALKELYGLNPSTMLNSNGSNDQQEAELSTDTQENDSKDSGEDDINVSDEGHSKEKKIDPFQQSEQQSQFKAKTVYLKQREVTNINKLEQIQFHQQQGDVQENMKYFVKIMNQEAQKLQMRTTQYSNPHGLSDKGNKSSAIDYGKLCNTAMSSFTIFREVVKTPQFTCQILLNKDVVLNNLNNKNNNTNQLNQTNNNIQNSQSTQNQQTIRQAFWENTNKLLKMNQYFIGIKTGNTPNAGPCLATYYQRDGIGIQVIVLKCKDSEKRWIDSQKLADWVYGQLKQEYVSFNNSENLTNNNRLMSASKNRRMKMQNNLKKKNKTLNHRPKSTQQSDNFHQKYIQSTPQSSQNYDMVKNLQGNNAQTPSNLQKPNFRNTLYSQKSVTQNYCTPQNNQQRHQAERNRSFHNKNNFELNSIIGQDSKPHNTTITSMIRCKTNHHTNKNSINTIHNFEDNNIIADKSIQILNKNIHLQPEKNGNDHTNQLISSDDFDGKEQLEDLDIHDTISFQKNTDIQTFKQQLLSVSFEDKMEELLHFNTIEQKNIMTNTQNTLNQLQVNKIFSSINNLDQPLTNSYRVLFRKQIKNNSQLNQQKPRTASSTQQRCQSEKVQFRQSQQPIQETNQNFVSPRRKVFYAKQLNNIQQSIKQSTQQSSQLCSFNTRPQSGKVVGFQQSESFKQGKILTLNNFTQPNQIKFINIDQKLPPLINDSLNNNLKKFSEDIQSSPQNCSKNLNKSLIKTIFN